MPSRLVAAATDGASEAAGVDNTAVWTVDVLTDTTDAAAAAFGTALRIEVDVFERALKPCGASAGAVVAVKPAPLLLLLLLLARALPVESALNREF